MKAPTLEPIKGGFAVRLRCGAGQHHRFRIHLTSEAAAQERAQRMAVLARIMVGAGKTAEAPIVLRKAGEQTTEAGIAAVETFVRDICGAQGEKLSPSLVTFQQLAERWTSGELARQYPDHVRTKKSTSEDQQRLAKLYPTIGHIPLVEFTVQNASRRWRPFRTDAYHRPGAIMRSSYRVCWVSGRGPASSSPALRCRAGSCLAPGSALRSITCDQPRTPSAWHARPSP